MFTYKIPILCDLSSFVFNVLYIDCILRQNFGELKVSEIRFTETTSAAPSRSWHSNIKIMFINISFKIL